ncbi:hypothetical protein CEXT_252481 [Caerostris extrusa]|uniref:Uncharacterized protein n=1 Tax=Caerostris extrusa TaxID=172846 RepID=A0AAV4MXP3_CAEEX|nr:hypothetical protein CEXT_252481 [Caerostris extrusa]
MRNLIGRRRANAATRTTLCRCEVSRGVVGREGRRGHLSLFIGRTRAGKRPGVGSAQLSEMPRTFFLSFLSLLIREQLIRFPRLV